MSKIRLPLFFLAPTAATFEPHLSNDNTVVLPLFARSGWARHFTVYVTRRFAMRRCVSASPCRGASGRRVTSASVRHGRIPVPDWQAFSNNPVPLLKAQLTQRVAPSPSRHEASSEHVKPNQRRRFSQLDSVLSTMRAAVDSVAEFCPGGTRAAEKDAKMESQSVVTNTAVPAFFRRAVSVSKHPRGVVDDNASTSAGGVVAASLPCTRISPNVEMCSPVVRPPGPPREGNRDHNERRGSRCSAGCAHAPRQPRSSQPLFHRQRSLSVTGPVQRLDTNARLALLMAALPTLGISGHADNAVASSAAEPYGSTRVRWANNLRSYAWRRVCNRCIGSGEMIGLGRAAIDPAVTALVLNQHKVPTSGEQIASRICQQCGQVDNDRESVMDERSWHRSSEDNANRPLQHVNGSDLRGRVGIVAALRSMSADRRAHCREQKLPDATLHSNDQRDIHDDVDAITNRITEDVRNPQNSAECAGSLTPADNTVPSSSDHAIPSSEQDAAADASPLEVTHVPQSSVPGRFPPMPDTADNMPPVASTATEAAAVEDITTNKQSDSSQTAFASAVPSPPAQLVNVEKCETAHVGLAGPQLDVTLAASTETTVDSNTHETSDAALSRHKTSSKAPPLANTMRSSHRADESGQSSEYEQRSITGTVANDSSFAEEVARVATAAVKNVFRSGQRFHGHEQAKAQRDPDASVEFAETASAERTSSSSSAAVQVRK